MLSMLAGCESGVTTPDDIPYVEQIVVSCILEPGKPAGRPLNVRPDELLDRIQGVSPAPDQHAHVIRAISWQDLDVSDAIDLLRLGVGVHVHQVKEALKELATCLVLLVQF